MAAKKKTAKKKIAKKKRGAKRVASKEDHAITSLKTRFRQARERIREFEGVVDEKNIRIKDLEGNVSELAGDVHKLTTKVNALEGSERGLEHKLACTEVSLEREKQSTKEQKAMTDLLKEVLVEGLRK